MSKPRKVRHIGGENTPSPMPAEQPTANNTEAFAPDAKAAASNTEATANNTNATARDAEAIANNTEATANNTKARVPSKAAKRAADEAVARQAAREREANGKGTKKGGAKKIRRGRIVLIAVLVVLVVCAAVVGKFLHDINNPQDLFQSTPPASTPSPTPVVNATTIDATPTPEATIDPEEALAAQADIDFMKNRVNVLVLGLDESTERANWGSFRTDTMILLTINFDTKAVDMISIPRDSYVKIANGEGKPTSKLGKVNSAFPSGGGAQKNGYQYAMGTVSYLLGGIPIDYYIGFNMNVVKEVVNAMGGVDYDVDIEVRMNGRELHPGMQHLDGQGVLDYCRQRKGSSDIARVDRQQRMLMAIFQQLKSSGQIWNLVDIYKAVEQNIQTNLSFSQISALALLAARMDFSQLGRHTLDGEFLDMNDVSYWGLRASGVKSLVNEIFGISISFDSDLDVSNVKAQIAASLALIAAELDDADTALKNAALIIKQYGDWLGGDTRAKLEAYISEVEDAVDMGDKEALDRATPRLASYSNAILEQLQAAGAFGEEPAA
ncbi:LCP family protein [Christensenellaceae bacterium OttesenSCG-928-L17]|nr:LCP family protein [Christensenellaceae bacterium OttesenSCG-928-L17]